MKKVLTLTLGFFFSLVNFSASCQSDTILALNKSELEFPHQPRRFEIVHAHLINIEDTSTTYILPDFNGEKFVYYFSIASLLPYAREMQEALIKKSIIKRHSLCLIESSSFDSILIVVDENANNDFTDEKIDTVKIGQPAYKKLNFVIDPLTNQRYKVPMQIEINRLGRKFEIYCKNLTKYELLHELEDTILRLNLLVNSWYVNFKIEDVDLKDGEVHPQNIRLEEPFFFNKKLRILYDFDLLKGCIKLRTLSSIETPLGYREGYYLDIKKLRNLSGSQFAWKKPKYFLLYFWGHWCAPCIARIEDTKRLAEDLKSSDEIVMINYPVIFKERDTIKLKNVISSNDLPWPQIIQVINPWDVEGGNANQDDIRNVVELAKIETYPSYLLINPDGKILYRGSNKEHELNSLLKELKIISN